MLSLHGLLGKPQALHRHHLAFLWSPIAPATPADYRGDPLALPPLLLEALAMTDEHDRPYQDHSPERRYTQRLPPLAPSLPVIQVISTNHEYHDNPTFCGHANKPTDTHSKAVPSTTDHVQTYNDSLQPVAILEDPKWQPVAMPGAPQPTNVQYPQLVLVPDHPKSLQATSTLV